MQLTYLLRKMAENENVSELEATLLIEAADELETSYGLLGRCRNQFQIYADHHEAKLSEGEEREDKMRINMHYVDIIKEFLLEGEKE
jgi:hypothetical protein